MGAYVSVAQKWSGRNFCSHAARLALLCSSACMQAHGRVCIGCALAPDAMHVGSACCCYRADVACSHVQTVQVTRRHFPRQLDPSLPACLPGAATPLLLPKHGSSKHLQLCARQAAQPLTSPCPSLHLIAPPTRSPPSLSATNCRPVHHHRPTAALRPRAAPPGLRILLVSSAKPTELPQQHDPVIGHESLRRAREVAAVSEAKSRWASAAAAAPQGHGQGRMCWPREWVVDWDSVYNRVQPYATFTAGVVFGLGW